VEHNPITVEGARLILQSAVKNEVCQVLKINDKLYDSVDDDEVEKMLKILKHRETLEVCKSKNYIVLVKVILSI